MNQAEFRGHAEAEGYREPKGAPFRLTNGTPWRGLPGSAMWW
jgi:hypothetical protein